MNHNWDKITDYIKFPYLKSDKWHHYLCKNCGVIKSVNNKWPKEKRSWSYWYKGDWISKVENCSEFMLKEIMK